MSLLPPVVKAVAPRELKAGAHCAADSCEPPIDSILKAARSSWLSWSPVPPMLVLMVRISILLSIVVDN